MFTVVRRPSNAKVLPTQWNYSYKQGRFKARLVVGGHKQVDGILINQTDKIIELFNEMQLVEPHHLLMLPMPAGLLLDSEEGKKLADFTKYRSLVSKLLYFSRTCRPDIYFAVNQLTRRSFAK